MKRVKASARVRITLDIKLKHTWGNECTVQQVESQAREKAVRLLRQRGVRVPELANAHVVGLPEVQLVLVEGA